VLRLVLPYLGDIYPLRAASELSSNHPAARMARRLADSLDLGSIRVAIEGSVPAFAGPGDPVPLRISPRVARQPDEAGFRFWVGRALATAATAGALLDSLNDVELAELLRAITDASPPTGSTQKLRKQVMRAIPRRVRKQVDQLPRPRISGDLWDRYRNLEAERADRIGLVLSGNPRMALAELAGEEPLRRVLTRSPRLSRLVAFAVSEEYAELHATLWAAGTTPRETT
jgi:hypothetical protein